MSALVGCGELCWVAAGEEVQVTQQDQVVARVVPSKPVATPDFLGRAKAVWGRSAARQTPQRRGVGGAGRRVVATKGGWPFEGLFNTFVMEDCAA